MSKSQDKRLLIQQGIPPATPDDLKLDLEAFRQELIERRYFVGWEAEYFHRLNRLAHHHEQEAEKALWNQAAQGGKDRERITTLEAEVCAWKEQARVSYADANAATERSARYTVKCAKLEAALKEAIMDPLRPPDPAEDVKSMTRICVSALTHTEEKPKPWMAKRGQGINKSQTEEKPGSCCWTDDGDGLWETECGEAFVFTDGGPAENKAKFCPYCGKPLDVTPQTEETPDD